MGVIRKKTARPGEGGVKYVCDVCSADITSTVRIRCAECSEYDLCVQCFADGRSSNTHRPETHPYQVIEQNSFPIFDSGWGADEELLLLEGAETYGLGSWADIADHIGGYRTKEEVRDHYLSVYVYSPRFPLPVQCSPHDLGLADEVPREEFQARKKRRIDERRDAAKSASSLQPKPKPTASVPACHEIQGYMPGRLEFDTEYANEAEEAVQLMQFDLGDGLNTKSGDTESELDLKLTVLEIYNCRLTQRVDRKKAIFEHNLLDYRENARLEKRRTKEEKDVMNRAKPFARIMNRHDFDEFCQGLVEELNLRQAIAQLQEWRGHSIGDLRSGERYELEKVARQQRLMPMGSMDRERLATTQRTKASALPVPEPVGGAALLVAPEAPQRLTSGTISTIGANSVNGSDTCNTTNGIHGGSSDGGDQHAHGLANGIHHNGVYMNGDQEPTVATALANGTGGDGGGGGGGEEAAAYHTNVVANHTAHDGNGARHRRMPQSVNGITPIVMSLDSAPDLHLLTPEEAKLCEVLRLQPKPYLMIKEQMLKEAIRGNGSLKRRQAREICRIDWQKGGRIFEFFISSGWLGKA